MSDAKLIAHKECRIQADLASDPSVLSGLVSLYIVFMLLFMKWTITYFPS